jgi:phosphoglycerate kinase
MLKKLLLKDLPLNGKKVLMRVDFNVPLDEKGNISDDTRIKESLPSIQYILEQGASLILASHLGRPDGKKNLKFSLAPCAKKLSELLKSPVKMAPDCVGSNVEKMVQHLQPKEILLLENLRFYEAEEKPERDPSFAKKLAALADFYVDDAFGTAHRKHSSTYSIAQYFPSKSAAGLLMEKEIRYLGRIVENPKRPFYAILGGAKISTKIGVIKNLIPKIDSLFLGGAMASTFFKAKGIDVGSSLVEDAHLDTAKEILSLCEKKRLALHLPIDLTIANAFQNDAQMKIVPANQSIPTGWQIVDIGPKTVEDWKKSFQEAATIFWNGPVGVFEMPNFSKGTNGIAQALAHSKAETIVGGGDSVAAIQKLGLQGSFSHLSTGGGASLEFIEFGRLPGIDVLSAKL